MEHVTLNCYQKNEKGVTPIEKIYSRNLNYPSIHPLAINTYP